MVNKKLKIVGIQNLFNQMWFRARGEQRMRSLLRRKKWGHYTKNSDPDAKWDYVSAPDATRFDNKSAASIVCDRLKADMPHAWWAVVEYKEVHEVTFKTLYRPKKGKTR